MNGIEQSAPALMKNIRRLCEEKGITYRELAQRMGVSSVSISRYCNGARIPSATTLYAMAKALDCRMDELMEGVEGEIPENEQGDAVEDA